MKKLLATTALLLALALPVEAATLLPPGRQTFFDSSGAPLIYGTVYFYQAGSHTIPKTTWKDAAQTQPNSNPMILDSQGSATIYGSGSYQEVVVSSTGTVVWDQPTADTAYVSNSWLWGGTSTGSANQQVVSLSSFSAATGQLVSFIAGYTNSGATTLNGYNVVKDTISGPMALAGGEIIAGNSISAVFDPTLQEFHLIEQSNYPPLWGGGLTTIASAATTDLCLGVPTAAVAVTGTTTITSLGSSCIVGQMKMVQFTGGLSLTNSSSLVLPGGINYTASAGSWAIFTYTATNTWQLSYPYTVTGVPQITVYTTGSGTYTTPAGARFLEVEMCGGGSGGGGGGTLATGGSGAAGGNTTFGTTFLTANGGQGTPLSNASSASSPATATGGDVNVSGGVGGVGSIFNSWYPAPSGASSPLGAGGFGAAEIYNGSTNAAVAAGVATGYCTGGGAGATTTLNANATTGWGGNSGAYLTKLITSPAATYSYAVGAAGAGGSAGGSGSGTAGAAGSSGFIKITARFQ